MCFGLVETCSISRYQLRAPIQAYIYASETVASIIRPFPHYYHLSLFVAFALYRLSLSSIDRLPAYFAFEAASRLEAPTLLCCFSLGAHP